MLSSTAVTSYSRHWRRASSLFAIAVVSSLSGCAMCCAPYDYDFGYTGGAWVRDNPSSGRVGSVFEPAGYQAVADTANQAAEAEPTPAEQPAPSDPEATPYPEAMPESGGAPPPNSLPPNMTSTPRLRRLQPYLPQN